MKARAVIFTHVQRPFTILGLPPKMVMVAGFGAMTTWMICIMVGLAGIAMLVGAAIMVAELVVCYYLGKTDPHVETVFLFATQFWRSSSRRWLLAGTPATRSRGRRS